MISSLTTITEVPLSKAVIHTCCIRAAGSQTDQAVVVLVAALNVCNGVGRW